MSVGGAVVFDFDGVLANSEPLHLRAYQIVLAGIGIELGRDEYYAKLLGFDDVGAFGAIGASRGLRWTGGEIADLVERKTHVFDGLLGSASTLYPGAVDCVERLAARYPLGIASGALRHEIETMLAGSGLTRHFQFIVASGDTPRSKPAPDPYRRAAELHGRPAASCVAIEDSRWGIEAAQAAGMRCVGITQTYPRHELTTADAIVDSLDEFTADLIDELLARGARPSTRPDTKR
jgi:beta-phosphoglucomutase